MNLLNLGISSWILILNLILLTILIVQANIKYSKHDKIYDNYKNYAQQVDITKVIKSNADVNNANQNYAELMHFIQNNPDKSVKFIEDIKNKFFTASCNIKSNIQFNNLTNSANGMIFN